MFLGKEQKTNKSSAKAGFSPLRRWRDAMGSGSNDKRDVATEEEGSRTSNAAKAAQLDLMRQVADFMTRYALPVTGANLSLVCDGLSGRNAALREALTKQELASQLIDEAWLDQSWPQPLQRESDSNERNDQMEELMDLMQNAMNEFQLTTKNARDATDAYRSAMDEQLNLQDGCDPAPGRRSISDPDSLSAGAAEFARLIELSRGMLDQLKTIEAEMERSQHEAENLRDSLAKARKEADADHLTGLPNRRAFERNLFAEVESAKQHETPLSIAFCDIDHFKQVNDVHGHEAGDRVLKAIAQSLSQIASDRCFVARHGGEEFVLLFSGLDQEEALEKLETVRIKLARRRLMNRETGKPFGQITFSGGVAQVDLEGDPRAALGQADRALYRAKESGRNQVLCA